MIAPVWSPLQCCRRGYGLATETTVACPGRLACWGAVRQVGRYLVQQSADWPSNGFSRRVLPKWRLVLDRSHLGLLAPRPLAAQPSRGLAVTASSGPANLSPRSLDGGVQPWDGPEVTEALAALVRGEGLRAVYQPMVDLDSQVVVGYEALARGVEGSVLGSPDRMFAAAHRHGLVPELDRACRRAAFAGASVALVPPLTLFVNQEPASLAGEHGAGGDPGWDEQPPGVPVVLELTERELAARPAELLTLIDAARDRGWGIAVDDVGAHPDSLTVLPLVAPDVIKLDLGLVQHLPSRTTLEVVHAVMAQAETTGAAVVAEGIETEQHLDTALAFGARYGQGWRFGRPAPLPTLPDVLGDGLALLGPPDGAVTGLTPFETVTREIGQREAPKHLCLAMIEQLEDQADSLELPPVVIATFERPELFTRRTARRYVRLAERSAFVAILGQGCTASPGTGVRSGRLDPSDPVADEWDVVIVGAHFAAAFVGRDLHPTEHIDPADLNRRFAFALTFRRDLVLQVARQLLRRVTPTPLAGHESLAMSTPATTSACLRNGATVRPRGRGTLRAPATSLRRQGWSHQERLRRCLPTVGRCPGRSS